MNLNFEAILRRSWELTRKSRWLWVYGTVLAMLGAGGGGGGGGGNNFSFSDAFKDASKEPSSDLPEKGAKVLGAVTDAISQWVTSVPIGLWVALGLGVLGLVLTGLVVNLIVSSWAKGGLIYGLSEADQDREVTLKNTAGKGLEKIKQMVILGAISSVIFLGIILCGLALAGLGALLFSGIPTALTIWLVLVVVFGVLGLMVTAVVLAMVNIYAERLVVLKGMSAWEGWKKGLSFSKKGFLNMVVLGIINSSISCSIGCLSLIILGVLLGIPAIVLLFPSLQNGFQFPGLPVIGFLVALFLLVSMLNLLIRAVFVVFQFGTWNLFFKQVIAEEESYA